MDTFSSKGSSKFKSKKYGVKNVDNKTSIYKSFKQSKV